MQDTITFYVSDEDKGKIIEFAKVSRLPVSTFCRFAILQLIKQKAEESKS